MNIYETITHNIITQLEQGHIPWVKPWQDSNIATGLLPFNGSTGKDYSGVNTLILWGTYYSSNAWYTFKQAKSLGGSVRKGEKGTHIMYYTIVKKEDKETNKTIQFPIAKSYTVFNYEQCEGIPEPKTHEQSITFTDALAFATDKGASVKYGGNKACYYPSNDYIAMPLLEQFKSKADHEATLLHELTHWTGHTSRLDRLKFIQSFGSESYAFEELIAEIGAAFLCAKLGVEGKLQHASYIATWLEILKNDKKAIIKAASMAQKSINFLLETATEDMQEAA